MRGPKPQPSKSDYAHCEDLLRRDDRDRWLASLFVPQALRPHIHALYAFSLEIARVRVIVSEPLLGEIRFQWWRDALDGTGEAGAKANPVAAALLDTIARFSLPKAPLLELIDARLRDLYDDPVESLAALESYTEATCANLFRLATQILDGEEVAAVLAALADLRATARAHLDTFDARLHSLPEKSRSAFLAVCLCEPYLRLMEKPGYDPFKTVIELPQWRRQWILWSAAGRWG